MYCRNCGNKIDENAYVCVNCGVLVNNVPKKKNKKKNSNASGIISIIFGIIAVVISFSSFLIDISEVGMYTKIYERICYAIGFNSFSILFATISLIFALIKKDNTCNKIGLAFSLISAFLIITEFMVVIVY